MFAVFFLINNLQFSIMRIVGIFCGSSNCWSSGVIVISRALWHIWHQSLIHSNVWQLKVTVMLYIGNVLALCHNAVIKQYCMCTMLQTRPNQNNNQ